MKKYSLFTFLFFLSCLQGFAEPLYTISDMGLGEGREPTLASSINNNGQVVGKFGTYGYVFLWEKDTGAIALFPTHGIPSTVPVENTAEIPFHAFLKINNLGDVAGNLTNVPEKKEYHHQEYGYIWDFENGFKFCHNKIFDFNDYRTAVGENGFVFSTEKGTYIKKPDIPKWIKEKLGEKIKNLSQNITSINNSGQMVGYASGMVADPTCPAYTRYVRFGIAFLIDGEEIKEIFPDVVKPEQCIFRTPSPGAINDQGQILCCDGAFIVSIDGTRIRLNGWKYGHPISMNNKGDVVGVYSDSQGGVNKACLWLDGEFYILKDLIENLDGWTRMEYAYDINDSGQIVGFGNKNGVTKAFLLNPK